MTNKILIICSIIVLFGGIIYFNTKINQELLNKISKIETQQIETDKKILNLHKQLILLKQENDSDQFTEISHEQWNELTEKFLKIHLAIEAYYERKN